MGKKIIDITGLRYGRLVVLELYGRHVSPNGTKKTTWLCKCDCGKEIVVTSNDLRSGHTRSCGCLKVDTNHEVPTTHGKHNTRLYNIWANIKQRCNNPNATGYSTYGGRGISMCDEWSNSFEAFYEWAMANGYRDDLSIDRIDCNGNYEPENCRWATQKQQCNNLRKNRRLEYNGEVHTVSEWAEIVGIKPRTLHCRIFRYGWDIERAFTTKVS